MGTDTTTQRILIIDDAKENIKLLSGILKDMGAVAFATSGEAGLRLARQKNFDIILLDVVMPGMDGFDVCRELKADPRTAPIPVLFVTARDEPSAEETGFQLGAVDYITKPYRPGVIRTRVRSQLDLIRTIAERDAALAELERLRTTDPVTGLLNRNAFFDQAEPLVALAMNKDRPLGVGLLDLDQFKGIKTTQGGRTGDAVLVAIANGCRRVLGETAVLCRSAGAEFLFLLPDVNDTQLLDNAYALLSEITNTAIETPDGPISVTACLGVATVEGSLSNSLSSADRALARAKAKGQNQVERGDPATA